MASKGYPEKYEKGFPISLPDAGGRRAHLRLPAQSVREMTLVYLRRPGAGRDGHRAPLWRRRWNGAYAPGGKGLTLKTPILSAATSAERALTGGRIRWYIALFVEKKPRSGTTRPALWLNDARESSGHRRAGAACVFSTVTTWKASAVRCLIRRRLRCFPSRSWITPSEEMPETGAQHVFCRGISARPVRSAGGFCGPVHPDPLPGGASRGAHREGLRRLRQSVGRGISTAEEIRH